MPARSLGARSVAFHPTEGRIGGRDGTVASLPFPIMKALLVSTVVVAAGEIGDKTQLLALLLGAFSFRDVADHCDIKLLLIDSHFTQ